MAESLYSTVRPLLLLSRVCGLLPVYDIKENTFSQIRFKKLSLLTCYWLLLWVGSLVIFCLSTYYILKFDIGVITTVSSIKLLTQFAPPALITPALLYVSLNCTGALKDWEEVESAMPPLSPKLRYMLWSAAKIIVVGKMAQNLVMDVADIEIKYRCVNDDMWSALHIQYNIKYAFLFQGTSFPSYSRVVLSLAYQVIMDIQWTCAPVLIITVSRTLVYRLHLLNSTLERNRDQVMPMKYWQTMRERYNNISRLTHIANNLLHPAILVCCVTETLFIILFFYMALNFQWMYQMYVGVSAAAIYHSYVILQLLLSMSAISELSRRPLTVLTSVPTIVYNVEVSRFYDQVVYDHLALTGGTFFDISRTFITDVVSTLISYEVVLMQTHIPLIRHSTGSNSTTILHGYCLHTVLPMYKGLLMANAH